MTTAQLGILAVNTTRKLGWCSRMGKYMTFSTVAYDRSEEWSRYVYMFTQSTWMLSSVCPHIYANKAPKKGEKLQESTLVVDKETYIISHKRYFECCWPVTMVIQGRNTLSILQWSTSQLASSLATGISAPQTRPDGCRSQWRIDCYRSWNWTWWPSQFRTCGSWEARYRSQRTVGLLFQMQSAGWMYVLSWDACFKISVAVSAGIPLSSPRKLFIFII